MITRLIILTLFAYICRGQTPPIQGKISGGFQAPSTVDPEGRRSVVKGTDATPQGNNVYLITEPRVTSYNPDDSPEMIISAERCLLDLKSNLAWSESSLAVRTADGRFALEGRGWRWDPHSSQLVISNQVSARVEKAVLASGATNQLSARQTNQPVRITATRFQQEGDHASFIGDVLVRDGADTLRCARLNLEFRHPGGIQKIEAVQDVELTQAGTQVRSGLAIYSLAENLLTITKSPTWSAEQREGSAEKLILNRSNNTLFAEGKVFMKLPLTNVVAGAVTNRAPQSNRFVEIFSDKFQFQDATSNQLATAVYEGNVRVVHPQAAIKTWELTARFDREQRLNGLHARGDVQIESEGNRAFGETADYDLAAEKFSLRGEPRWEMDRNKGRSELVVFYPQTEELHALGKVQMLLPLESTGGLLSLPTAINAPRTNSHLQITSGTFSHQENVSVFHDNVRISDDRGRIDCELMTVVSGVSNQVQRIIAEENVRITQQDMTATGDRADYDVRTGLIHLSGNPQLAGPDKSLRAEAFIINRLANTFSVEPGTFRIEIRPKKSDRPPNR